MSFITNVLHYGISFAHRTSLAENIALTTGTLSGAEDGFIFLIYWRHKVKKGFFLKTLQQNNTILRRAALSGP